MNALSKWTKRRKTVASTLVVALIAGIPLTVAALHPGFPVSDVQIMSKDVWVTNGEQLLGGRLNRQINELNGSVTAASSTFDVLQDGDTLFMHDRENNRIEAVSPASTEVTSAIELPAGSEVAYGGATLAIMSPKGELWGITAVGDLQFNYVSAPPLAELGEGSHVAVTTEGAILAVSPSKKTFVRIDTLADAPVVSEFTAVGEFQLAAVGDIGVVFDQSTNELLTESGSTYDLGETEAIRLQQSSHEAGYAALATGDSLLKVDLGSGSVETVSAQMDTEARSAEDVSAPVSLDGCVHGAWSVGQRYVLACDGQEPEPADIPQPTQGNELEFRVNRDVIALNDLANGNVWLVDDNMRLVENWEDVVPPEEEEAEEEGDEKSAIQSFEDTLAERTETNRPPTANDDEFGVRPGRTTILPLLDNDTDPDGDVLVISAYDAIQDGTGRLDAIDGSRALQFTPNPEYSGTIAFSYTIDDGRGGTDQARVTVRVTPTAINNPPEAVREAGVGVEANQTVTYNVLNDWKDPDGDDLYLVGAAPKSGDLVRFTPDGFVTFTHQTSELGDKEVSFQVSDGQGEPAQGILRVAVSPAGSVNPIGTPDFASTFTSETVVIEPLANDLSPSGAQLALAAIEEPGNGAVASMNADRGTVTFSSSAPGTFYVKYTLAAGAAQSVGIIRVDVVDKPTDEELPPIAVKDTAYLRGEEPVTISVLSNDVSPLGRILAVQGVQVAAELKAKGLVVELLESTLIRITSPAALTEQVNFTYTISDGTSTATAGVTVVPVPALTRHQPPIAQNDVSTVRAGDITTLNVLDNDYHPDDSSMFLDEELITPPTAGLAFVSKNMLRFQAPNEPGEYRVDYRVRDPFGETAAATATFTVTPYDEDANRDPVPDPLIGRVLAGGNIRVDIPLHGIDPDGDSTQLLRFPTNPTLGTIDEIGLDYFVYKSSAASAGTDVFSYEVYDAFGATGTAEIKIAVIPEPDELQEPSAVPDSVSIRPGRTAQVDLLANDSDPQGAPIKVSETLIDVPDGIVAEVVDKRYLVIKAPETEQSFSLRYELSNDRGGKAISYVLVQVTPDAPILPPTADDLPILTKEIAGKQSITVDVLDGFAFNPAGRTEDLIVTVEGPNARSATALEENGQIEVTPGERRQAIAYRVTNEADELSAMAFILVPAAVDEDFDNPPYIDPNLPIQYVSMNETREWKIADLVIVPSGRDAWIAEESTVSAVQSNGEPVFVDRDTIRFTPPTDYRGPAAINFGVTDGSSKNDPKGIKASLTLPIVVGDPEFRDTPPEFTTPNTQVELGETTTIDLRASTGHPNPTILGQVTYSNITGTSQGLQADLSGSTLTMTTPRNAKKGSTYTLGVTLRWDKFEVPGTINVTVVGSSRPLAVAVSDAYETKRGNAPMNVAPLINDSNPYQTTGEALRIVDAKVQNTGEAGTVTFTDDSIRITPGATVIGDINIIYTIEDATQDADRRVNGTAVLTVSDVPDKVARPTPDGGSSVGGDANATFRFTAPATNGKDITGYEVRTSPEGSAAPPTNCTAGAPCTITGLQNGTAYVFSARAINFHGAGAWSDPSQQVTPYGTPADVGGYSVAGQNRWAPGSWTWNWAAVGATGGTTTYYWTTSWGQSGNTTGTSAGFSGQPAGNHTITVYAQNPGGKRSPNSTTSPAVQVRTQPAPSNPGKPSASGGQAPRTLTFNWSAPGNATADQAGEGLVYDWSASNGASGTTGGTSASLNNVGAGNYWLQVTARNSGGSSGTVRSDNVNVSQPPPTEWTLTANVNTCPESPSFSGRWGPGGCESPGYVTQGTNVVVSCIRYTSNSSYSAWYKIKRGSGHALYDGGYFLANTTMNGSTSGMPEC